MYLMEPKSVFDAEQWREEALAVIKDIECGVAEARISDAISCTNISAFLNVTTVEGERLCVEMNGRGFRVIGHDYDRVDAPLRKDDSRYYETPYALMNVVSLQFSMKFGETLVDKLQALQDSES